MEYKESNIIVEEFVSDIHDFTIMNYKKQSIIRVQNASVIQNFTNGNGNCINAFVKNVVLAIVTGKIFYFDADDTPKVAAISRKLAFFTENSNGENFEIEDEDLCDVLSQFPKFAIAKDGMMVFYTSQKLVATYDCKSCVCVNRAELDLPEFNSISEGDNGYLAIKGTSEFDLDYTIWPDFDFHGKPLLEGLDLFL